MDPNKLLWIIPPTIALGILWYFIKLLGKMIDDYNAYSDDRAYSCELTGLTFFINYIIYPSIFTVLTIYFLVHYNLISFMPQWVLTWIPPLSIFVIYAVYSIKIKFVALNFFDREEEVNLYDFIFGVMDLLIKDWGTNCKKFFFKSVKHDKIWIYVLFTLGGLNYFSNSWIIYPFTYLFIFLSLLIIPSNHAMIRHKLLKANLIIKGAENINDCKIIRVNDDCIRLKKDNKITPFNI